MDMIDTLLDTTLVGYSRVGFAARRLDVMEKFPRLADRHVVVSGATGGIGSAVARRLVDNGAVVHAIGRTPAKLDRLVGSMDGHVVPHLADLSSMRDVRAVVESITATAPHVDAIANNVGVMEPQRRITAEGFERTYATNLLGQYVLTEGLRPAFTDGTRVVFVSSGGMYSQPLGDVESSQGDYTPTHAYARTKRGQVSLATELSTRIEYRGRYVVSMHPGWVDTAGVRDSLPRFRRFVKPWLRSEDEGADTIVWLIGRPECGATTGAFFHDRRPRRKHRLRSTRVDGTTTSRFIDKLQTDAAPYLD